MWARRLCGYPVRRYPRPIGDSCLQQLGRRVTSGRASAERIIRLMGPELMNETGYWKLKDMLSTRGRLEPCAA